MQTRQTAKDFSLCIHFWKPSHLYDIWIVIWSRVGFSIFDKIQLNLKSCHNMLLGLLHMKNLYHTIAIDRNKHMYNFNHSHTAFFSQEMDEKSYVIKFSCALDIWNLKISMKFIDWPKYMCSVKNTVHEL